MHGAANSRSDVGTSRLRLADRPRRGEREVDFKTPYPHITPALTPKKHTERRTGEKKKPTERGALRPKC